jgi:2-deoxy-D-gluconate 3-dehydrogenase
MARKDFSMDFFSLKGKVAIITGANTGLGIGYAQAFARAGADLFIPHFIEDVSEVKSVVEAEGRRVEFLQGDLTDKEYIRKVIDTCLEKYGKIDILVNNAGANCFAPYDDFPDEKFEMVMKVDLHAVYYLSHEVGKIMKQQGHGKIINIGSALSFTADNNCPPYVISKHGVIGLTRWLCNELGQYNVQANALCPGFLATEMNRGQREGNPAFYNKITDRIAAGHWGDPVELAGTMVYLASQASDYVNGWYISVDGGFTTVL